MDGYVPLYTDVIFHLSYSEINSLIRTGFGSGH